MMSLKPNLSVPRNEVHDFRPDVLVLKPVGSAVPDNLALHVP